MSQRLNRAELLRAFESVSAGLAKKEVLQQSTCLVFHGGNLWTFNDEVACCRPSPLKVEGAVRAKTLIDLLAKLNEDEVLILVEDGQLVVRGSSKHAGFTMETEVALPVDSIERPESWKPLHEKFGTAVNIVHSCASVEASQFVLTCIHIHPKHVEACDRFQMARYPLDTGLDQSILVRADSLKEMASMSMKEIAQTSNWVHFRNEEGLVVSCRKYMDDYVDLGKHLTEVDAAPVSLPGGLEEVVSRCQIFSSDNAESDLVAVDLKSDWIVLGGEGPAGWYKERQKVSYAGPPVKFNISPKLLLEISRKSNECRIDANRISIDMADYRYVSSTEPEQEADSVEA